MKKLFCLLFFAALLLLCVGAKSTVIYQNDFSSPDLSDFYQYGNFTVKDGCLYNLSGNGPSAFLSYTLPEEYKGAHYQVDVDMMNKSVMGGILIGGEGKGLSTVPSYFHGYTCTASNTNHAYICYFNKDGGWGGSFAPGTPVIPEKLLHFTVRIEGDVMTFRVSDADTGELYYGVRYERGTHENDLYDRFTETVGLRKYYDAETYFDNFTVTLLEDDELPAMPKSATVGGVKVHYAGLSLKSDAASGSGAFLSDAPLSGDYKVSASVTVKGNTRLYFGMTDEKNGYAFTLREDEGDVTLCRITDGVFTELGEKAAVLRQGYADLILTVSGGVTKIVYDDLFEGDSAYPKFEFTLPETTDGRFGFSLEGGELSGLTVGVPEDVPAYDTYINPVSWGADPDMLYYDGTYYLYNSVNNGTDIFRVYTSPDLAHFTPRNVVFKNDLHYSGADISSAWSPNVFYHDGLFYLLFAAKEVSTAEGDSDRRIYYATSDSPYGPFLPKSNKFVPIHKGIKEIDGHPFRDTDGRIYISYSRYDLAGTIWLEEAIFKDGVITPLTDTATRVIISDKPYDTDGAIRLCEGGVVWKHGDLYYLIYATTSYTRHYGQAYAVSENVLGPYVKYEHNPILKYNYALDGPGDALIIPSPDGSELFFVYHRHYEVGKLSPRQTCVDRIKFVPNPDGGPDILTVYGPTSTPQPLPSNAFRYDSNRDGRVSLADALTVQRYIQDAAYTGRCDIDANGSLGRNDVTALLKEIVK